MRKRNPVLGVSLRLLVAGYLLYIAYVQFSSIPTTDHVALTIVFGILFAAVGVFFAIWAIFAYRQDTKPQPKEEEESKTDVIETEATEITETVEEAPSVSEEAETDASDSEDASPIHEVSEEELED